MNLLFGEVVEVLSEDGMRMGRICVGGAQRKVAFELIQDAVPGDLVLLCDGVAISKVAPAENSPAPASALQNIDH